MYIRFFQIGFTRQHIRASVAGLLCALGLMLGAGVCAQDYPSRPITIILPLEPGGPGDVMARYLAQAMARTLKQNVVVENASGAGGTIGTARAAKANPDGHTLLLNHIAMATAPALYRNLSYHPINDFEPIGLVADVPLMIFGRRDPPPADFREFAAYLKAQGKKVNYGDAGVGSASELCGLLFTSALGTEVTNVNYKGTAAALNDLLGGRIDFMCDAQTPASAGLINSGKIKLYGITSRARVQSLPNVPTLDELGLKGFEATIWRGLYAPRGTARPIIEKLSLTLQEALRDTEFRAQLQKLGTEPVTIASATPDALRAHLKSEIEKWGALIRKSGRFAD